MISIDDRHDKIMAFIDGGYIYSALVALNRHLVVGAMLDLIRKAANEVPGKNDLRRVYYYNALPPLYSDDNLRKRNDHLIRQAELRLSKPIKQVQREVRSMVITKAPHADILKKLGITDDEYNAQKELDRATAQMRYYENMQHRGAKVILTKLKHDSFGKYFQKGIDVYIASDILSLAFENAYDIAILVSGDSDFIEVVDKVRERGKLSFLASFKYGKSYDLQKSCDGFIDLEKLLPLP
jgi:uncharacterized LabA/DUF88 family protein